MIIITSRWYHHQLLLHEEEQGRRWIVVCPLFSSWLRLLSDDEIRRGCHARGQPLPRDDDDEWLGRGCPRPREGGGWYSGVQDIIYIIIIIIIIIMVVNVISSMGECC